jgi:methylmalonyl-CoA mutase N-terminal domain/subunit
MNPDTTNRQIERLRKVRAERDEARVCAALAALRQAAEGDENLMPRIVDAVRAYASIGEMTAVLREVFGEFQEPVQF